MQDRHHPPEGGTGGIQDSGQIAGPPHAAVHGTDLGHRQSSHPAGTRGASQHRPQPRPAWRVTAGKWHAAGDKTPCPGSGPWTNPAASRGSRAPSHPPAAAQSLPGQSLTMVTKLRSPGTPALAHPPSQKTPATRFVASSSPGTRPPGRHAAPAAMPHRLAITMRSHGTYKIRRYARQPGRPDGWLAPRRTGRPASGHSRSQRPCQRFGSAGERAHSPRRASLSLHRAISGRGDPVSHEDRASRPAQEALPASPAQVHAQPPLSDRRQGKSCSSAAGRLRSDAAGTSPPAISLAEHRVESGVGPDRPDLLRAAAGNGDLGSPPERLLA